MKIDSHLPKADDERKTVTAEFRRNYYYVVLTHRRRGWHRPGAADKWRASGGNQKCVGTRARGCKSCDHSKNDIEAHPVLLTKTALDGWDTKCYDYEPEYCHYRHLTFLSLLSLICRFKKGTQSEPKVSRVLWMTESVYKTDIPISQIYRVQSRAQQQASQQGRSRDDLPV